MPVHNLQSSKPTHNRGQKNFTHQNCRWDRTNSVPSATHRPRGSAGTDRVDIPCLEKNGSGPSERTVRLRCCAQVHHPSAIKTSIISTRVPHSRKYLIVEAAFRFQKVKELLVRFAPPEIHVSYFEVAPDYKYLRMCSTPLARVDSQ